MAIDTRIDTLLQLLETADDSALSEIDIRIQEHKVAIEKLTKARKLLGGVAPTKKSVGPGSASGPRLREQIVQWMKSQNLTTASVSQLATALNRTHQSICMTAVKNPEMMSVQNGFLSIKSA